MKSFKKRKRSFLPRLGQVSSFIVTSDNKYIITRNTDNKTKIFNLFDKRKNTIVMELDQYFNLTISIYVVNQKNGNIKQLI